MTYDKYREDIRKEIVIQRLREREVDQRDLGERRRGRRVPRVAERAGRR